MTINVVFTSNVVSGDPPIYLEGIDISITFNMTVVIETPPPAEGDTGGGGPVETLPPYFGIAVVNTKKESEYYDSPSLSFSISSDKHSATLSGKISDIFKREITYIKKDGSTATSESFAGLEEDFQAVTKYSLNDTNTKMFYANLTWWYGNFADGHSPTLSGTFTQPFEIDLDFEQEKKNLNGEISKGGFANGSLVDKPIKYVKDLIKKAEDLQKKYEGAIEIIKLIKDVGKLLTMKNLDDLAPALQNLTNNKKFQEFVKDVKIPNIDLPKVELPKLPSLGSIKLPSLPTFSAPSIDIPKIDIPKMPDVSLPKITLPALGGIKMPSLGDASFSIPKLTIPEFPKMPELPKVELPKIELPKFNTSLPQIGSIKLPNIPSFDTPKLPDMPKMPSIPDLELPKIPDLSLPNVEIPNIKLPGLPDNIKLPDVNEILNEIKKIGDNPTVKSLIQEYDKLLAGAKHA